MTLYIENVFLIIYIKKSVSWLIVPNVEVHAVGGLMLNMPIFLKMWMFFMHTDFRS